MTLKYGMDTSLLSQSFSRELVSIVTIFFYGTGMVLGFWGLFARRTKLQDMGCWLALIGFLFQTVMLFLGFHHGGLSSGAYLQMLAWFVGLAGLALWRFLRQKGAPILAIPLCLTLFIMSIPYLGNAILLPKTVQSSFYVLHIGTLFMSFALISVSFIVSLLFLLLERRIKGKQSLKGFMQDVPALSLLDKINAFGILTAFPLYTLGMISGLLRAKPTYGATFTGDPKEVFSIVIWCLFAVLFHNRLVRAWTGKKPALMVVCIFCLCAFSLLVVNTVMESHHAFVRP